MSKDLQKNSLSRRTFVKGLAATACLTGAGAIALPGCTNATAPTQEANQVTTAAIDEKEVTRGCSFGCMGGCYLKCKVRDGRLVHVTAADCPDTRYNGVCVKSLSWPHNIYGPGRLQYPMRRAGERGEGKWEQITWDEAIDEICAKVKDIWVQYGKTAIASYAISASQTAVGLNAYHRLFSFMETTRCGHSYDLANALANYFAYGGAGSNFCFNAGNEVSDIFNAKWNVFWGINMELSIPQKVHWHLEAKDEGQKWIVIDSNFTFFASKADIYVPIRPASDGAFALGVCNAILEKDGLDVEFLKARTVAPLLVRNDTGMFLRQADIGGPAPEDPTTDLNFVVWDEAAGTHGAIAEVATPALNGSFTIEGIEVRTAYDLLLERLKEFPISEVANICDVSEDLIYQVADVFINEGPVSITAGMGLDHYTNGMPNCWNLYTIAMLTGNAGKPGCTLNYPNHTGAIYNTAYTGTTSALAEDSNQEQISITVPATKFTETLETGMYAGQPLDIKAWFITSGNPMGINTDRQAMIKALDKLDLIVCANIQTGDSIQYCDYVLPVSSAFEHEDLGNFINQSPYAIYHNKVIDPLYDTKTDYEIACMLAEGLGLGEHFTRTESEHLDTFLDTDFARLMVGTREEFKAKGAVDLWPRQEEEGLVYGGGGRPFSTSTGRMQFYLETTFPMNYYGQVWDTKKVALNYWDPPLEAWHENELFAKYPLVVFQEASRFRVHTMFAYVESLRELDPEPICRMNPIDADARGIKAGDKVKVFNDRGYVIVRAVIDGGRRPGQINVPRGWQHDQFIEGHLQDLTHSMTDDYMINQAYYDVLAEVEKVEE